MKSERQEILTNWRGVEFSQLITEDFGPLPL